MTASISEWIVDHRKFFIASWFVIAVVMIAPAVSSFGMMDNTIGNMDEKNTSTELYVQQYFDEPELDYYRMPMIVIDYWNEEGFRQIMGDVDLEPLSDYIRERFAEDDAWNEKIDFEKEGVVLLEMDGDINDGSQVLGILFKKNITDEQIYDMAGDLRATVNQYKSDYAYELYESELFFNVHLTGNSVVLKDTSEVFLKNIIISAIVVSLFVVIVMGLFFGSAFTAIISGLSMATSAVTTLAMVYFITAAFSVPATIAAIAILLVMILSFAHSVLTFSFYRNELMNGKEKDEALRDVIKRTSSIFVPFIGCLAICSIVLMCTGVQILFIFGLLTLVGLIILCLVSMTLPISLMNLTKNELLWKLEGHDKEIWNPIKKINSAINGFFSKTTEVTSKDSTRSLIAIAVVLVVLIAGGIGYMVAKDSFANVSYDTVTATDTGDSKAAVNAMINNDIGGIYAPYEIIIDYNRPIATITTDSLHTQKYMEWSDVNYYKEIKNLESQIASAAGSSVFTVSSLECWDELVNEAKAADPSLSGQDLIDSVVLRLSSTNRPASIALQWVLDDLEIIHTPEYIISFCGPRIDYCMNYSTGTFGYHMTENNSIVIDRIMINVFMTKTATSSQSMNAADRIDSAVGSFISNSGSMSGYRHMGSTVVNKDITGDLKSKAPISAVIMCILVLIAAALIERKLIFTSVGLVMSVSGIIISSAITFIIVDILNIGNLYFIMPLVMLLSTMIITLWFGFMQCSEAVYSHDVRTMKRCVDPIIIITSGSLAIFAISMMFTDVEIIDQTALVILIAVLIQGLIMRLIISSHLWNLARMDLSKIRFRHRSE